IGQTMTIGGSVSISTEDDRTLASGVSAQGGESLLYAENGGSIDIAGDAALSAAAFGGTGFGSLTSGHGTGGAARVFAHDRSEEHTSELQSLMRNSYAVF